MGSQQFPLPFARGKPLASLLGCKRGFKIAFQYDGYFGGSDEMSQNGKIQFQRNKKVLRWSVLFLCVLGFLNAGCSAGFRVDSADQTVTSLEQPGGSTTTTTTVTTTSSTTSTTLASGAGSRPTNGAGGATGNSTGTCGSRNYALHVPANYNASQAIPIVVAMYGLGDDYQNFNSVAASLGWHSTADQQKFIFMVPASTNPDRQSFLHFNPDMSPDWAGIRNEMTTLLDCVYHGVGSKYNIETMKIYWIGFSEGASFTNVAASYLSKEIRAVGIYGGSAPRLTAEIHRLIPLYYLAGTSDFNYNAITQQSADWSAHPHVYNWVSATHSFSQLNSLVPPTTVWTWMSTVAAEPVQSGY